MSKGWFGESRRHGMAKMGYKTVLPNGMRFHMADFVASGKRIEIDWEKGFLTEKEINLIKNRMNTGEKVDLSYLYEQRDTTSEGMLLTPEQNRKGYEWLMNQWKTPRGDERKNNPFGYREQDILDNFDHFELIDFYDAGNINRSFYVPYYEVVSKNGATFEYVMVGGEIKILG